MDSLPQRLKALWISAGTKTRPGVTPDEIKTFEAHYNIFLPKDVSDYFQCIDGMAESEFDDDFFSFLPLHEVRRVTEELVNFRGIPDYGNITQTLSETKQWFVFIDYLIRSHVYAIKLSMDRCAQTPIIWISGSSWGLVANSFTDFCEIYLAGRTGLLMI